MEQVIIIGAGPCGLSAAIELKRVGIDPLMIEKGAVVQSIYQYPTFMIFHSTAELLEIGDIPFTTVHEKPTRLEALNYYRLVAARNKLRIHSYEEVTVIEPITGGFRVLSRDRFGVEHSYECERVVVATGYFDHPNKLGIPGEELSKVSSFYKEAHPYTGLNVAIVGGNNSAVDAALDLERAGAKVTVICRGKELSSHVKAWTRPLFLSAESKGKIKVLYESQVTEIQERAIRVNVKGEEIVLENDFVFTLIGFRPDRTFLRSLGVKTDAETGIPEHNPETMETNIPGVYIAGVVASGNHANAIFIENGRFHGRLIAKHIADERNGRAKN